MTRNLKALGLAFAAMLVVGAMTASAASAQKGWLTSDGPVTLTAEETESEGGTNALTAFGAEVHCEDTYTGHEIMTFEETAGVEHKDVEVGDRMLPAKSTEVTLTPHYTNCTGPLGWVATVDMNGCDYELFLGETVAEHEYETTIDIVCPEGKEITVTMFRNATGHENNESHCDIHVPAQSELTGATAIDTNTNDGHVELVGEVHSIKATKTSTGAPLLCPNQETEAAIFHIDATVSGHNEAGNPTDIKLTD